MSFPYTLDLAFVKLANNKDFNHNTPAFTIDLDAGWFLHK